MPLPTNYRTFLEPQDLEALRKLAKHIGFVLPTGQLAGEGSLRQLMIALAGAVRRNGVRAVAAELSNVIPPRG